MSANHPGVLDVVSVRERIESALTRIRPALRADGGDAEVVEVTPEGHVTVRLLGACGGCPMSPMTLKQGIEKVIRSEIPEVREVHAVEGPGR